MYGSDQNSTSYTVAFNKPFDFSYGAWQDKVKIVNGIASLRGSGLTPKGGAGFNFNPSLDLSKFSDHSPQLSVKVGASNKMPILKMLFLDADGNQGTWEFALPPSSTQTVVLTPKDGASLGKPNFLDVYDQKSPVRPVNLKKLAQFQLLGDWSNDNVVDVEVSAVELVPPSEAVKAQRLLIAQKEKAERERINAENEALRVKYQKRNDLSPVIRHIAPVASDVLAIEIVAGRVIPASLTKYVKQPGDETSEKKTGSTTVVTLKRGGKEVGWLIGPKRDWFSAREGYRGDPLLEFVADKTATYSVASSDDIEYSKGMKPLLVGRKTKPIDWALESGDMQMKHTIYLRLPKPLKAGKKYTINLGALNTKTANASFVNAPHKVRSEAVHVNQIGFRPDDTPKRAFVSCWMGTGGSLKLPTTLNFSLIDDKTQTAVFSGKSRDLWPASKIEQMNRDANFSGTDIMRLDFSSFKKPGRYRVLVEGLGTSYPFNIARDVWTKAFKIQMKGLYNQRSGVKIGAPYSTFKRPADMIPGDAANTSVTWTKYRAVEDGQEAWQKIEDGDTGKPAPGYGGYRDAGDWNPRRVSHMAITMVQLEALDLFPETYATLDLNIPKRAGVPDILTEAIFEFETFRRLQQKDGGVSYGLETNGDPVAGEVSWLQSMKIYALSPEYRSSYFYATVGARLSRLLKPYDAKLAGVYQKSAIAAFDWAEKDFARDKAAGLTAKRGDTWQVVDQRNYAALELLRLTRDKKYHDLFLQDSVLKDAQPKLFTWAKAVQRDQAFWYATMPKGLRDESLKKKAIAGVATLGDLALEYANNNAFNLTTSDKGKPQFIGFYSMPDAGDLVHAHYLTKNPKYLAGAIQATQFSSGCNPNNIVYTTGLGANPIKHPLMLDSRRTGQAAPVGITTYGNVDLAKWNDNGVTWPITWHLSKNTTPNPYEWPTNENYFDISLFVMQNEFVVDLWVPNVVVWSYLAARP